MSCVTGVTGTTGTKFYTQHTRFNILKEIRHAVDESQIKSKTKRTAVDLVNLKDFMDTISHQPSEWKDMEHCYMTHDFCEILELMSLVNLSIGIRMIPLI